MTKIFIDSEPEKESQSQNFTEILGSVGKDLPDTKLITEVRIDGKQFHRFADTSKDRLKLAHFKQISIQTGYRDFWATNGWESCLQSVESLRESLIHCPLEENEKSTHYFRHIVEALEKFVDEVHLSCHSQNIELSALKYQNYTLLQLERETQGLIRKAEIALSPFSIDELLSVIDFGLMTNLQSWHGFLTSTIKQQQTTLY